MAVPSKMQIALARSLIAQRDEPGAREQIAKILGTCEGTDQMADVVMRLAAEPGAPEGQSPELVASVPPTMVGVRRQFATYQTIHRMVESANTSILVFGFWLTDRAAETVALMADAAARRVKVTLVLDDENDNLAPLARMWPPKAPRPRVLVPNREKWTKGTMHAKAVVIDANSALVTSANLTGKATELNLELGTLVQGRVASEIQSFMIQLLERGMLREAAVKWIP